jgi:hypothetical protein
MTLRLAPINHRWQLVDLVPYTKAVEVGTHRGVFAEQLARVRRGLPGWGTLYCIDPWADPPGYEAQAAMLGDGATGDRDADYREARRVLRPYLATDEVILIRGMSPEAAGAFDDGSLDLVYLDADHSYDGVRDDLAAWWPTVRPGGLLAGHDFLCPGEVGGGWGQYTQRAVTEFAAARDLDVFLVVEPDGQPWSFYLEKPK